MTQAEIVERLREIVRERLRIDDSVHLETDLQGDLQLDSLQQLELWIEIENEFRICLEPADEREIHTVSDLVTCIGCQLADSRR